MATRLYLKDGQIVMVEPIPVFYDEMIVSELSVDDSPIIENGVVVPLEGSELQKKMKEYSDQHPIGGRQDYKYVVNITTKNKKKYAVVHKASEGIDYDEERGDKVFDNLEKAEAYANEINNLNF